MQSQWTCWEILTWDSNTHHEAGHRLPQSIHTHTHTLLIHQQHRNEQSSSIALIGSDHYSITPCLRSPSVALSRTMNHNHTNGHLTLTAHFLHSFSFLSLFLSHTYYPRPVLSLVDHDGGGPDVLLAVQTEDMSQVGEQHQRWRLQLQLLPTQNRALRRCVQIPNPCSGAVLERVVQDTLQLLCT